MNMTKASALALAAILALPLGIAAGRAFASAQSVQPHPSVTGSSKAARQSDSETNDTKDNDVEKPDAESAKEPKETVDRDHLQQGPGNVSDGDRETNDGPG